MLDWLEDHGFHFTAATLCGSAVSRWAHNLFWKDKDQSLCARAWAEDQMFVIWLIGSRHCWRSWQHYNK